MKLLIIGGTVFLGRHLAEIALSKGHDVTIFNRGTRDDAIRPGIERLKGDRRHDLTALLGRRWDAAIDTCGYVPSAVSATTKLLKDSIEHYTFVSSQSVYANYDQTGIDERYEVQELTDDQITQAEAIEPAGKVIAVSYGQMYGGLKALCERAAEIEMPGRTLCIRAGLIVGPLDYSDRFTYWVRRIAAGGEVLVPGKPERPVQLIDVRDLASWMIIMAEKRQAGVFNATGPKSKLSFRKLLNDCRDASNGDARFTWVNDEFIKSMNVSGWSELPLWLPAEDNIDNFFSVNCSKAISQGLSFRPAIETARDTLTWDNVRTGTLNAGLSRERELELLRAWHNLS